MAMTKRAFWDPQKGQEVVQYVKTMADVINELNEKVELMEKRIKDLETTYMEDKLLGKEPGKIEE